VQVIEDDVCIICAGLWMGFGEGTHSHTSYSTANDPENWGSVLLEDDDDLTLDGTYHDIVCEKRMFFYINILFTNK
jgi:hypothetical protein